VALPLLRILLESIDLLERFCSSESAPACQATPAQPPAGRQRARARSMQNPPHQRPRGRPTMPPRRSQAGPWLNFVPLSLPAWRPARLLHWPIVPPHMPSPLHFPVPNAMRTGPWFGPRQYVRRRRAAQRCGVMPQRHGTEIEALYWVVASAWFAAHLAWHSPSLGSSTHVCAKPKPPPPDLAVLGASPSTPHSR